MSTCLTIEPDGFVPGNHEFDFGPENFRARIKQSTFPVIATNVSEKDGAAVAGALREKIIEIEGTKIGIYASPRKTP